MEKESGGNSSLSSYIVVFSFFGLLFALLLANILSPDKAYSEMENRALSQKPSISIADINNGELSTKTEAYVTEQFAGRDAFVLFKSTADLLCGRTLQNNVYLGKEGYYLQDYHYNKTLVSNNIKILNQFALNVADDADISFLLVPNSVYICSDKLPNVSYTDNQLETIDYISKQITKKINFVSPYKELLESDNRDELFYKTDHHWTAKGAFTGYRALMRAMGEETPNIRYTTEHASDFLGTLYSKAPVPFVCSDTIELPTNLQNDITVKYAISTGDHEIPSESNLVNGTAILNGLYVKSYQNKKDKYATFLGGNFALLQIETQGINDEHVLIIKDSYANAMIPYLCDQYKHLSVMDMRYYDSSTQSVPEYVRSNKITKVIFVYNVDFINSDHSLVKLSN